MNGCQGLACSMTSWSPPTLVTWEMGEESYFARLEQCAHGLRTWNGWLIPAFPREEVDRIAAYNREHGVELDLDQLSWRGDTLVASSHLGTSDEWVEAIEPVDIDGIPHWPVGAMGWTWQHALTADDLELAGRDPGLRDT